MSKALSRNLRDLDDDTREAARAAARRSGKSLGDWLDDAIREQAELGQSDDDDFREDDEDRLDTATRRLARPRLAAESARAPRRWRDEAEERRPSRHRSERHDEPRDRGRRWRDDADIDPETIIENAAEIVERRLSRDERRTAQALENLTGLIQRGQRGRIEADDGLSALAERLNSIESRLAEQPATNARPLRSALARLETRLDRLSNEDRTADFENTLSGLDRRLDEIARRLDDDAREREARVVANSSGAGASMNNASPAALEQGLRRVDPSARRPLVDAIAEITERQRALDVNAPAAPPAAQHFDALQNSLEAISLQLETVRQDAGERADQQMVVMRQVEGLRREVENMSRALGDLAPRASVAAIEIALRDLGHRIESQRGRGVADDLLAPAERIAGELRAVIKDLDPSPIVRNLHADVQTIGRRLDAMQSPEGVDAAALHELSNQTREVKDLLTTLAARPLPLEKLETRLFDLTQRVDTLTLAGAGPAAAKDMGELVKAIRSIVSTETGASFETFNRRLEQLVGKLDDAVGRTGVARFDELGERIDQLGKTLAQRIDRGVAQKAAETGPLEQLVAKLAKKIDHALDHKGHGPAFEEIGRKLEKLETRFRDPAPAASIARIEALLSKPAADQQFAELAQRIDLVHKTLAARLEQDLGPREAADVRHIEEMVRGLDQKIEAALSSEGGARDRQSIERQLGQLAYKLDRLDDPAVKRRLEARQDELAALVEQLASKMNQALDPRADAGALNALERQIAELSQRLDHTDHNGVALAAIEAKIGELVARIEHTRAATTDAAEVAVRRATQDILREAASVEPGALNASVERELTDLRKTQNESGQRTHETLLAVHETLERVVDRLAVFEDELSDIRTAPPARVAAPAPPSSAAPVASPAVDERRPHVVTSDDDDMFDFLLPPGAPSPVRREPAMDIDALDDEEPAASRSVQSDFIAAARRAAQQAARDAETAQAQNARRAAARPEAAARSAAGIGKVGSTIQARKRPLLLGLGALVLLIGAYQVARVSIEGVAPLAPTAHHEAEPVAESAPEADAKGGAQSGAAVEAPAARPDAQPPAAKPVAKPVAPPPRMIAPPSTAPAAPSSGSDVRGARQPGFVAPPPADPAPKSVSGLAASAEGMVDRTPVGAIANSTITVQEATAVIKTLAAQGDPAAQFEMGVRHAEGRGMARDAKSAAQWFEKAAEHDLAPAQYRLGSLYEKGVGVERDYARARKWYQLAAENGNARSMHNLAVLCAEGGDGKPDYVAAAEWFRKAAEYGVRDSQYNLAILYARGLGVGPSLPHSYMWFSVAAAQGDEDAAKKRDEVGARLDTKELAAAKALLDGFQVKQPISEANDVLPPAGGWENVKDAAPAHPAAKSLGKPLARPLAKPKVSQM